MPGHMQLLCWPGHTPGQSKLVQSRRRRAEEQVFIVLAEGGAGLSEGFKLSSGRKLLVKHFKLKAK